MKRLVALFCLLPGLAYGQAAVRQTGPVTNNSPVMWAQDGVVRQGAGAAGDVAGKMIEGGFSAVGNICSYNDTTDAASYRSMCLDAVNGVLSYNGVNYSPTIGSGNVSGPSPTTINSLVLWNNLVGTAVKDGTNVAVTHNWTFPVVAALTNTFEVNVGSFPSASEIPANVLQGVVAKVAVPATFTQQPWPATAISGYITNGNTASASSTVVALFGFAGQTSGAGSPGTPFGLNVIVANCPEVGCANGSGLANGNLVGAEIDVDLRKIGAATPIGQAVGLFITGDAEVVPTNGAYAARVKHFGIGGDVPWTVGYQTDNGAATTGMVLGAAATSGAANSQPLVWGANNGGAIFMSASLDQTQYLQFLGTPDAGGIAALNILARNSFKMGTIGSNWNVLTSVGGTNTTLYGDLGTAALIMQNTVPQTLHRNTTHTFQTINGATNFAVINALGINTVALLLSGVNAHTLSGTAQTLYGEAGTATLLMSNATPTNQYLNTTHQFQDPTQAQTFLIADANGIKLRALTVATLPACAAGTKGYLARVTDANAPAYNTNVAGGGAVDITVRCDGTNWKAS